MIYESGYPHSLLDCVRNPAISAFAALVSMGGSPKVSIFMGKGDNEQAEKVMGSCGSGNEYDS